MPNPIDLITLVLIIAAGLLVGIVGFFGVNLAEAMFGSHISLIYEIVGVSAIWQLLRQRFL
jgi:uncharacterized membrane protein YuzA (DUF378 family)